MSRTISIVVLLAVIAPSFLVFSSLRQSSEDKLPACCRRDGKHHCAMMSTAMLSSETQMSALPEACPFRSQATVLTHATAYLPEASLLHFAGLQSHPAIQAQTHAIRRISELRSHQKRGPPLNIFS